MLNAEIELTREREVTVRKPQTKIAIVTDVHFGEAIPDSRRRYEIADILMERAVRRLNRLVRPDVVLVLGDLVDDGDSPSAEPRLRQLRETLDKLEAPHLVIPGNHDGDPERFYRVFPHPGPFEDIGGVRFLAFVDREEPGYNASRGTEDIERIRLARHDFAGPIVTLQHTCLFPLGQQDVAPYNYLNADDIISAMKEAGVLLSVSGHHHRGTRDTHEAGITFVNAPGLCEAPFPFLEITIENGRVETERHELTMPPELQLVDNHLHTQLAYCSENMSVEKTIALAREFGLAGITFTEHAGQLYFDRKPYWNNAWFTADIESIDEADDRMAAYLDLKRAHEDDFARFSLEVECDARGRLLLKPDHRVHFKTLMGTIHALSGLTKEAPPRQQHLDEFLYLVESMARQGIRILAHPTRIFRRTGWDTPTELFEPTARILREHSVAAEINFHANEPPLDFVRCCLDHGVRFSLGSDSHHLSEIGDFACHLALLREAGFDGDLRDVLIGKPS